FRPPRDHAVAHASDCTPIPRTDAVSRAIAMPGIRGLLRRGKIAAPALCAMGIDHPPMSANEADLVIWGIPLAGRPFRPSDWAERLAGLVSVFGNDQRLAYSPYV